jgi:hypothetical protein
MRKWRSFSHFIPFGDRCAPKIYIRNKKPSYADFWIRSYKSYDLFPEWSFQGYIPPVSHFSILEQVGIKKAALE